MAETVTTIPAPVKATDLRLVAGYWPLEVTYKGQRWMRDRFVWGRDVLAFVVYRHGAARLKVYNNHRDGA